MEQHWECTWHNHLTSRQQRCQDRQHGRNQPEGHFTLQCVRVHLQPTAGSGAEEKRRAAFHAAQDRVAAMDVMLSGTAGNYMVDDVGTFCLVHVLSSVK